MDLDDELCLCFHVTLRKVRNFLRIERPRRAGQMSDCFGAGTGCGWCRPFLVRLFEEARQQQLASESEGTVPALPASDAYARQRAAYVRAGRGTPPPGAAPLPGESRETETDATG